jgi:hypothetical protein
MELAGLEPATSWVRCRLPVLPDNGDLQGLPDDRTEAVNLEIGADLRGFPSFQALRGDECL